jgi:D-sedoheptulose 7-phosphate isomerase
MIFTDYNPYNWLKKLNKTILSARCRKNGRPMGLEEGCCSAGELIKQTIESGASIWWVGNGGSAAISSHLSQDLLNKLGARSFFLGDSALMTCMANDFGYENVYAKPLEKLISSKDLLIAISSSGNSENIIRCAELALEKGMNLITLSGFKETNRLWNISANVSFFVSADLYGIVEVSHEAILHSVIESLWQEETQVFKKRQPQKDPFV